jgi:hypothetical protein
LVALDAQNLGVFYVYCDPGDYFSRHQETELRQICPTIVFRKTAKSMSWGGVNTIENELIGFNQIRKEVDPEDLIMNVDADAVFISSSILERVEKSNADLIGHSITHFFEAEWDHSIKSPNITFHQGSCYFLRAKFTKKMAKEYLENSTEIISWVSTTCSVPPRAIPPDVTMGRIASMLNAKIEYTSYIVPKESSIIHLELTKDNYWHSFGRFLGIQQAGKHQVVKQD